MGAAERMIDDTRKASAAVEEQADALARELAKVCCGEHPEDTGRRYLYQDAFRAGFLMGHAAAERDRD